MIVSAPASAKASRNGSTGEIIRWTSNGLAVCGRSAFTTAGPMVRFGHEMAVHHVDMDPVGARRVDGADLLAEPGEIGREDGGGDTDRLLHARTLTLPESRGKEGRRLIPA